VIIQYKLENGQVVRRIVHTRNGPQSRGEPLPPDQHFSQTLLKAYYDLECTHKFRSKYPKSVIKRAHETAIQRWEQTGQEV
jgi:hypothetical protein